MNNIRGLAELLRQQGGDEDTVLAHINPYEAQMLEDMGGSGEINPVTGLPQYGWGLGAALGGLAGTFVGAPMLGAMFGGGVGSSKSRRRKRREEEELDEGFLSKLGGKSSDFFSDPANLLALGSTAASALSRPKRERKLSPEEMGDEQLRMMLASQIPPEQLAALQRRYQKASRMSPEEIREAALYQQMLEQAKWEAANNLAPGERLQIDPVYRKDNDEDEYKKTGRWFEYYNDPDFRGRRINMADGGYVNNVFNDYEDDDYEDQPYFYAKGGIVPGKGYMEISISSAPGLSDIFKTLFGRYEDQHSGYIHGDDGGQDDTVEARLSPGEYVIDAETVAHLGDGNSQAGAKKLDEFIKRVREHKRSASNHMIAPSIDLSDV